MPTPRPDSGAGASAGSQAPRAPAPHQTPHGQGQQIRVPGGYVVYDSSNGQLYLKDGTPLPGWKIGSGGVVKGGKILHLMPNGQPVVETRTTTITPGSAPSGSGPQVAPQPGQATPSGGGSTGQAHTTSTWTTLDGHAIDNLAEFSSPQGPGLPARNDHPGQPHPAPSRPAPVYSDPVRQFQAAHGLVVDGIVGPKTIAAGWGGSGTNSSSPSTLAYGIGPRQPVTMAVGTAKALLDAGMRVIGVPYVWGGNSLTTGVDCSGLVQQLYKQQGINLPRVADDQAKAGVGVSAADAQPGDLIAFDNDPTKPGMDHIGIYLGGGKMLQAPHTGANVQVVNVDLSTAGAIRRVLPSNAFAGLGKTSNGLVYQIPANIDTSGSTPPTSISSAMGGGGMAGGSIGLPADPTVAQINDAVAKNFGYLSAFLNDPEVGPILRQGAMAGWDQSTLFGHLYNTKWWQNTSATTRQWDSDQKLDPASNRAKLDPVMADLTTQAQRAGLYLSTLQIHDIGVNSLRFGWNAQQTTNALLSVGKLQLGPESAPSDALSSKQALKQIANQYHVPVSDAALDKWTGDIVAGRMSTTDFQAYAANQAKSLFPSIASAIDQGHTVEQYLDPYRQIAAQTLDRGPDSFDFINDPKFSAALNQIDPKTGQRTAMSLADFQTKLKSDPSYGFQNTAAAKSSAADLSETIGQMWGAVA